eukprot:855084-Prymnesium_polylepis.2
MNLSAPVHFPADDWRAPSFAWCHALTSLNICWPPRHGAPHHPLSPGCAAVFAAVLDDDAVGVTHFFNDNSSCVNQRDEKGWMPIHIAAEQGYSNALHALLRCEADMEAFDDGQCAREKLNLACARGT